MREGADGETRLSDSGEVPGAEDYGKDDWVVRRIGNALEEIEYCIGEKFNEFNDKVLFIAYVAVRKSE